jgi:hypothetical protein
LKGRYTLKGLNWYAGRQNEGLPLTKRLSD